MTETKVYECLGKAYGGRIIYGDSYNDATEHMMALIS